MIEPIIGSPTYEAGHRGTDIRLQGPRPVRQTGRGTARGRQHAARRAPPPRDGLHARLGHAEVGRDLKTEIEIPGFSDRVKLREVAVFTRQFATMVDSGLSMVRSLGMLAAQVENQALARVLTRSASTSSTGRRCRPPAPSTRRCSPTCSARWSRPARSAGASTRCSGAWPTPREAGELNRKIRSAMTYPVVVLLRDAGHLHRDDRLHRPGLQEAVHVPRRQAAVADADPDQHLATSSPAPGSCWSSWSIVGAIVGFRKWIETDEGRRKWDRFKLKPPVFGPLVHKAALARMTGTLASLIGSACRSSSRSTSAPTRREIARSATCSSRRRTGSAKAGRSPIRCASTKTSSRPGRPDDRGGRTDRCARRDAPEVADFYDQEVEVTVDNLTSLLEPLLTVIMGVDGRSDHHLPLPADVRLHQAGPELWLILAERARLRGGVVVAVARPRGQITA